MNAHTPRRSLLASVALVPVTTAARPAPAAAAPLPKPTAIAPSDTALLALAAQWQVADATARAAQDAQEAAVSGVAKGTGVAAKMTHAERCLDEVVSILQAMAVTPAATALGLAAKSVPVLAAQLAFGALSDAEAALLEAVAQDQARLLAPMLAEPPAPPLGCPVAALLPELHTAHLVENHGRKVRRGRRSVADIEEAVSLMPAVSHAGALLHIGLAHADIVSVLDTGEASVTNEELLDRAERCLWSAFHALGAAGNCLPRELAVHYGSPYLNPFG